MTARILAISTLILAGANAGPTAQATAQPTHFTPGDVDGDGKADLAVWRGSNGTWYWLPSSANFNTSAAGSKQWGMLSLGDVPLTGDVDGDGKADLVVWRASTGTWYWLKSSAGYNTASAGSRQWGNQGLGDVPMLGDVDGDGKADLIVWRASTGTWHWLTSSTNYSMNAAGSKQWGNQGLGDTPLLGDFDGDGKADFAVWRSSTGTFHWLTSSSGYDNAKARSVQWGNSGYGDVPMLGDIDGDGKADLVVWRPTNGVWYWLDSGAACWYAADYCGSGNRQFGNQGMGDIPMLGDMDGDGKDDFVVWRASTGTWHWSTWKYVYPYPYYTGSSKQWGNAGLGDQPILK